MPLFLNKHVDKDLSIVIILKLSHQNTVYGEILSKVRRDVMSQHLCLNTPERGMKAAEVCAWYENCGSMLPCKNFTSAPQQRWRRVLSNLVQNNIQVNTHHRVFILRVNV